MKCFTDLPRAVTVYEVGPRDGLQNESDMVPTRIKVAFVDLLSDSGLPFIEVSSFVRPGLIPQLSDAEDVFRDIRRADGTRYVGLVPNVRGMERATACGPDGVALFTAASETFSTKNTNATIEETLERFRPVALRTRVEGIWLRAYVSTVFGCPYEGPVTANSVLKVTRLLDDLGVDEIVLSDTIGVATPRQVAEMIAAVSGEIDKTRLALHFHDTRGTALANVLAGLQMGITIFDASAGGLGGCPYAPGATGNLATEDLLYLLNGLGINTGVSLDAVVRATAYLRDKTGRVPPSRYFRAATA